MKGISIFSIAFRSLHTLKNKNLAMQKWAKLSLSYILKIFLNFIKFESQYSYKLYSYKKVGSSCSQLFFKIDVLKNFENFTGKHLCWSFFFMKLQTFRPATLLKRDSNTGNLLWNLWNFKNICEGLLLKMLFLTTSSWKNKHWAVGGLLTVDDQP